MFLPIHIHQSMWMGTDGLPSNLDPIDRGWDTQSPMPIVKLVLICKAMGICLIFVNIEVLSKSILRTASLQNIKQIPIALQIITGLTIGIGIGCPTVCWAHKPKQFCWFFLKDMLFMNELSISVLHVLLFHFMNKDIRLILMNRLSNLQINDCVKI